MGLRDSGMGLVCRWTPGQLPRKRQRQRLLEVSKAAPFRPATWEVSSRNRPWVWGAGGRPGFSVCVSACVHPFAVLELPGTGMAGKEMRAFLRVRTDQEGERGQGGKGVARQVSAAPRLRTALRLPRGGGRGGGALPSVSAPGFGQRFSGPRGTLRSVSAPGCGQRLAKAQFSPLILLWGVQGRDGDELPDVSGRFAPSLKELKK